MSKQKRSEREASDIGSRDKQDVSNIRRSGDTSLSDIRKRSWPTTTLAGWEIARSKNTFSVDEIISILIYYTFFSRAPLKFSASDVTGSSI